jgi:hypothetical protein
MNLDLIVMGAVSFHAAGDCLIIVGAYANM